MSDYMNLVADGAARMCLVVVSAPMLHLPPGIVKRQDQWDAQAIRNVPLNDLMNELSSIGPAARPTYRG